MLNVFFIVSLAWASLWEVVDGFAPVAVSLTAVVAVVVAVAQAAVARVGSAIITEETLREILDLEAGIGLPGTVEQGIGLPGSGLRGTVVRGAAGEGLLVVLDQEAALWAMAEEIEGALWAERRRVASTKAWRFTKQGIKPVVPGNRQPGAKARAKALRAVTRR